VFDHRGFGDSGGERDLFDPRRQLEDWRVAIAAARALPGVDAERVVTFGSSMGAGNALAAAATDGRVAAAISQVPFLDLVRQAHRSTIGAALRMLLAAVRGRHMPVVGRPGEAAFINSPGGEAGWRHVVSLDGESRWRNRASTRWLLGRPFRPARHASRLHCPWLVCVGEADQVARPAPAISAARRAPRGELRTYPGVDHFDIYDGPAHDALVADEVEFLRRYVGV
jgi:pimeloyl-ACP methyl ester carboxylesterase